MIEAVRELGQQTLAAAWDAARVMGDPEVLAQRLGGASQPLDVGRDHRLVTKAIRIALNLRDQGCAFPHCDATLAVCEAHHIRPWWGGGPTCLANLVLVCPFHHRLIEPDPCKDAEAQWQVRIQPATGLPEFLPPTWIDPARSPRQHRRTLIDQWRQTTTDHKTDSGAAASKNGTAAAHTEKPPFGSFERGPDLAGQTPTPEHGAPPCPEQPRTRTFKPIPELDPKDDPWHPDYQPPPRTPPQPSPSPTAAGWSHSLAT